MGHLYIWQLKRVCYIYLARAEEKMQQEVGELYSQVDTQQAKLHEADAKERMLHAKLENAQHEVCWQQICLQKV